MEKKKMTIEDLAVMTQKGFLELGTELRSEMREGFADIVNLKADMKIVKSDISGLKENSNNILTNIDYLVGTAKKQEQEHLFLNAQVRRLETRVDKLERKTSS